MSDAQLVVLVMGLSALPLFAFAYFIGRGHLHLLNGIDASRLQDPATVARTVALQLTCMGVALVGAGAALAWAGDSDTHARWIVVALVTVVMALTLAMLRTLVAARNSYRPMRPRRD